MSKNKEYLLWGIKIVCILCFIGLVFPLFASSKTSDKPFEEVLNGTIQNIDMSKYPQKDALAIKRYLGLDSSSFDQIVFYRTDDAMDADELVLARFSSEEAKNAFEESLKKRMDSQTTTYEGYAPDQFELMKNGKLVVYDNYGLYVIGPQADQIAQQFEASL